MTSIFGGPAYEPAADRARLQTQIGRIHVFMLGVGWKTLGEIRRDLETMFRPTIFPEASISAQLRHLRRGPYYCVLEKRRRGNVKRGLWEYRLQPRVEPVGQDRQAELFDRQAA